MGLSNVLLSFFFSTQPICPLDLDQTKSSRRLTNMFQPCRIPKTEERGITVTQLCDVYDVIDGQSATWRAAKRFGNQLLNLAPKEMNLYHVNDNWITVKSKPYKCSYVELVAFGPQFPLWFISQ